MSPGQIPVFLAPAKHCESLALDRGAPSLHLLFYALWASLNTSIYRYRLLSDAIRGSHTFWNSTCDLTSRAPQDVGTMMPASSSLCSPYVGGFTYPLTDELPLLGIDHSPSGPRKDMTMALLLQAAPQAPTNIASPWHHFGAPRSQS